MKVIQLLYLAGAQAFYRWALREIDPMHPDVAVILARQCELESKYRRLWR